MILDLEKKEPKVLFVVKPHSLDPNSSGAAQLPTCLDGHNRSSAVDPLEVASFFSISIFDQGLPV